MVGGGIVGLFTAWYLEKDGADVTLFEEGPIGAGSVHAAGIIEPENAYRTNTVAFLRRVWRLWKRGTCTFRQFDGTWLFESLHQLERTPAEGMDASLREMADTSMAQYEALAQEKNDFQYTPSGVLESYDDPRHFAHERDLALARKSYFPVEVREGEGASGALFFPSVSWLHTEQFAGRIARELVGTKVERRRVRRVELGGTVVTDAGGGSLRRRRRLHRGKLSKRGRAAHRGPGIWVAHARPSPPECRRDFRGPRHRRGPILRRAQGHGGLGLRPLDQSIPGRECVEDRARSGPHRYDT